MEFRQISRILGRYLLYFSYILCIPLLVALLYEFFLFESHPQPHSSKAFFFTFLICLTLALLFRGFGRKTEKTLYRKESILLVTFIWLITAFISALPFTLSHTLKNPIDAYFEAMSGLTTTGATILYPKSYDDLGHELPITLKSSMDPKVSYTFYGNVSPVIDENGKVVHTGVEAIGKALLFWRSFIQWLGGMGIVVLFIAVLPALGMGGKFLYEAEMPGPNKEALTPRIKETASLLWKIYLGLTVFQAALLMTTNTSMPFFDAITLSFSTISTGGFSIHNDGLGAYHNVNTEWVIILFMFFGSVNFSLYFYCIKRKIYRIYEPEFFTFIATLLIGSLLMTYAIWNTPKIIFEGSQGAFTFLEALRYGSFQAISSQTSTGFSIADYGLWPFTSQILMLILMFFGGMSGSTSGGIKIARYCILFRLIGNKVESLFRPEAVRCLKIGSKEITAKTAVTVLVFFCVVIGLTVIGTLLLVFDGVDPQSALSVITCVVNNAGLVFGVVDPTQSCAFLSNFSKILTILWMLLGRLEFFALLVLFSPSFWKNR